MEGCVILFLHKEKMEIRRSVATAIPAWQFKLASAGYDFGARFRSSANRLWAVAGNRHAGVAGKLRS
jgi:hypothetical protein